MESPKLHGRVIVGIVLIIIGTIFVLHNYDILYIPSDYFNTGYFFILLGILFLLLARNKTAGIVLLAIGLFLTEPSLWPVILILIGARIIFGRISTYQNRIDSATAQPNMRTVQSNNYVESVSVFGGGSQVIHSNNFKGGNIVSIFGGSEINLAGCSLANGGNVIEITAIFGGSTLIVPSDWKVKIDILPIFGGFGDKRIKDPNKIFIEGKTLVIKGLVLFGGGEIKNY